MIAPSILSADFLHLDKEMEMLNNSCCGRVHLDIMDGVFVPNITFGFPVIKSFANALKKPMDAHLMIVDPDRYVEKFAHLGVEYLSVHYEACPYLQTSLQSIRSFGMKAGVAINPQTPVAKLADFLPYCDFVVVMSVNPGFAGQKFIAGSIEKVAELRRMIDERGINCSIEVDGGVNKDNVAMLSKAGADILVAGNAVFSAPDPLAEIAYLTSLEGR